MLEKKRVAKPNYEDAMSGAISQTPQAQGLRNPGTPSAQTQTQEQGRKIDLSQGPKQNTFLDSGNVKPTYSTEQENDPYAYLKETAATELLSAGTQATIAEQIARKNLATDLQRQGLANSGYAGTAGAMISNAGAGQQAKAVADYNEAMRQINAQEAKDASDALAARADNITSSLSGFATQEERNIYLENMGLVQDGSGRWVNGQNTNYTDTMLEGINTAYATSNSQTSASSKTQSGTDMRTFLQYFDSADTMSKFLTDRGFVYDKETGKWTYDGDEYDAATVDYVNVTWNAVNASGSKAEPGQAGYAYSFEELGNVTAGSNNDKKFADEYGWEYNALQADVRDGNIKDGDVMVFRRGDGKGVPMYLRYENGKFVIMSKEEWEAYDGEYTQYTNNSGEKKTKDESHPLYEDKPATKFDKDTGKTTKDGRKIYKLNGTVIVGSNAEYYYIDPNTGKVVPCDEDGNPI